MNNDLRQKLISVASQEDVFMHYDEVAEILGLTNSRLDHSTMMNQALEDISVYEHNHGRPLLTAVVVHKEDLRPGQGFFKMAKHNGKQKPHEDNDVFFINELERVRNYWKERNELIDSIESQASGTILFNEGFECCGDKGKWCTEKVTIPDNCLLFYKFKRRRLRLLPLCFRSAKVQIVLRDAETGAVAKNAMRQNCGKVTVKGEIGMYFGIKMDGRCVIQEGGTYYLEISWGSLVKWWRVAILKEMSEQ